MKVVIAGTRTFCTYAILLEAIEACGFDITHVVSGGAQGADRLGEKWAKARSIPVTIFRPNWQEQGIAAGPIRNKQMAEFGDALIALWDGKSKGTKNMIETMRKLGKPVYVHTIDED